MSAWSTGTSSPPLSCTRSATTASMREVWPRRVWISSGLASGGPDVVAREDAQVVDREDVRRIGHGHQRAGRRARSAPAPPGSGARSSRRSGAPTAGSTPSARVKTPTPMRIAIARASWSRVIRSSATSTSPSLRPSVFWRAIASSRIAGGDVAEAHQHLPEGLAARDARPAPSAAPAGRPPRGAAGGRGRRGRAAGGGRAAGARARAGGARGAGGATGAAAAGRGRSMAPAGASAAAVTGAVGVLGGGGRSPSESAARVDRLMGPGEALRPG